MARVTLRRASQRTAIPSWCEKEEIDTLYEKARQLTNETGLPHQVDHIVPLKHKRVCGLHCIANLQILTAEVNQQKSNTFEI